MNASRSGSRPAVPPAPILLLAVIGISWAAIFVRWSHVAPVTLAFWRLTLSLLVVATALSLRGEWSRLRDLEGAHLPWILLAGALLALHFVTWFVSLDLTSVASSTFLVNLQPLFAAALSAVWLGERPVRGEWAGITIAVAGAGVIGGGDLQTTGLLGNALAVAAGAMAAAYYVIGRRVRVTIGLWPYVGCVYSVAALCLAVTMTLRGEAFVGYPAREWWIFAGLASGPMLLGHTGFNWALRYVRAYIVNLAVLGEPVGATLLAWWLLGAGERPGPTTVAGGFLILTGLVISIYFRRGAKSG